MDTTIIIDEPNPERLAVWLEYNARDVQYQSFKTQDGRLLTVQPPQRGGQKRDDIHYIALVMLGTIEPVPLPSGEEYEDDELPRIWIAQFDLVPASDQKTAIRVQCFRRIIEPYVDGLLSKLRDEWHVTSPPNGYMVPEDDTLRLWRSAIDQEPRIIEKDRHEKRWAVVDRREKRIPANIGDVCNTILHYMTAEKELPCPFPVSEGDLSIFLFRDRRLEHEDVPSLATRIASNSPRVVMCMSAQACWPRGATGKDQNWDSREDGIRFVLLRQGSQTKLEAECRHRLLLPYFGALWAKVEGDWPDDAGKDAKAKAGGNPGLDRKQRVHRLSLAQQAEEMKAKCPSKLWKEIARAVGWQGISSSDMHLLKYARDELARLMDKDPDKLLLEVAEERRRKETKK